MDDLSERNGRRLRAIRTRLDPSGVVTWGSANFAAMFENGVVTTITHLQTCDSVDVRSYKIDATSSLDKPWDDLLSKFVRHPLPPIFLHTLFEKGQGPLAHADVNKPQNFKEVLEVVLRKREASRKEKRTVAEAIAEAGKESAKSVRDTLTKKKEVADTEKMMALRAKAKSTMLTLKRSQQFSLT